ncbi:MAG TPA: phosphoribosyltransferase family protein [Pyrinomonadaceae bacterium]|jgi:orotate phosphoribosyltransferase
MSERDVTGLFLGLVEGRRGHFRLESGHHGRLWLDLDALFAEPRRVEPFVGALAAALRPYEVDAVCGPLLGGAFLAQLVAQALGAEFWFAERVTARRTEGLYGVSYRLPPALRARAGGRRVAVVDDVMSAGSSLRATHEELRARGAEMVVAGALLVLGSRGAQHFAGLGVPVEAVAREEYQTWEPAACPLCAAGAPLEDAGAAEVR